MGKDKSGLITALVIGGGAFALYWYLNNYGPNGAISAAGGLSWWQSWFGGAALPTTGATPTTSTTSTFPGMTSPAPTTAAPAATQPVATQPASTAPAAFNVTVQGTVTPDINNSLKATVNVNGQTMTINVIPANAGGNTGVIYNTSGTDITSQFTSAQQAQIVLAVQSAYNAGGTATPASNTAALTAFAQCVARNPMNPASCIGLSGIVPVPWNQSGMRALSGVGMNFSGKAFGGGFGSRKKSTTPLIN